MFEINENVEIVSADKEEIIIVNNQKVLSLNSTAKEILDQLRKSKTRNEVVRTMIGVYGENNKLEIKKSVDSFIEQLEGEGIIEEK